MTVEISEVSFVFGGNIQRTEVHLINIAQALACSAQPAFARGLHLLIGLHDILNWHLKFPAFPPDLCYFETRRTFNKYPIHQWPPI